ncbi:PepSY domain-containing protein [Rheinheimera sp.]|uniref:PepSY domain-containing protein n=1 Tax=Rheinheimera sp. TaxID=1869214 RepID=UPI002FDEC00E
MWRKLHVWGGVLIAIPMLIIGVSTIFIAHGDAWGAKQITFGEVKPDAELKRVLTTAQGIMLGGKQGVVLLDDAGQVKQSWLPQLDIKALRELNGQVYASGKMGLYQQQQDDWLQLYQGDVEDMTLQQGKLTLLVKHVGLVQQQGQEWQVLRADSGKEEARNLDKLMMDLHSGKAIFGKYDWIWMDVLGAYIIIFTLTGVWLWSRRSQF